MHINKDEVYKMKIVRLNLSDEEYQTTYDKAIEEGFANIQDYLRFVLFEEKLNNIDYEELLTKFEKGVVKIKKGDEFRVRDCFDKEEWGKIPAQNRRDLGRMIFRKVEKGGWITITPTRKDSANAQWYKK
jgi:rubrerythrin